MLKPWRNSSSSPRVHRTVCALIMLQVAVALTAVAVHSIARSDHLANPWLYGSVGVALGWSFVAGGLIAMLYTTARRIAWLMLSTGLLQLLLLNSASDVSWMFSLGTMFAAVPLVLIGIIVLSFPSGRLEGVLPRSAAALGVFCTALMPLLWMPLISSENLCRESPVNGGTCPENLFLVSGGSELYGPLLADLSRAFGLVAIALAIVAIHFRWRDGSAAWRHAVAPVAWTGSIMLVFMLAGVGDELVGRPLGSSLFSAFQISAMLVPIAFIAGLVRARLERAEAVELMARLGAATNPDELQTKLAGALRDPSLEVLFRVEDGSYVDGAGQRRDPFVVTLDRAVTPIAVRGEQVGALLHDPALENEPELLESVGGAASLALVNHSLQAELRGRLDELRDSRARIVEAGDEARREIERNLHDGTQQRLASIRMSLGLAESRFTMDPEGARQIVSEAKTALGEALDELRTLSQGVHPGALTERGLGVAVKELAYSSPLPIEINVDLPDRLPEPVEAGAYYVVAEALANATKHSQTDQIKVGVERRNGSAYVCVSDNGVGGADPRGNGLRGLSDRVEALGGRLSVVSPLGAGTTIEADLPCEL